MSFSLGTLTNYTKENEQLLIAKSMFGARTAQLVQKEGNILTGVKSAEKINILDTDATFQSGGTCGFTSSATTSITQRTLTVGKIKVMESLCPADLEAKYTQKALPTGSDYDAIPFEQDYTDRKAGKIAEQLEVAFWQGDTTAINANLNKFDGYIKLIDAAGTAIAANSATFISGGAIASGTGITVGNVKSIVAAMWLALPARVQGKSDVRFFCGWDTFNKYIAAYADLNLFHFAPKGSEVGQEAGEVTIIGTNYKLTAVHGLDGTNRLFGMRMSNMWIGTDLEHEEEKWKLVFAEEADEVRFTAKWKHGVQVAFPDEIVQFELTA